MDGIYLISQFTTICCVLLNVVVRQHRGTDLSEPNRTQGQTELLAGIGEIKASMEANDRPQQREASRVHNAIHK